MIKHYSYLWLLLLLLVLLSGFFSGSETGMMSLNRYRLRHKVRQGDKASKQILSLLLRPDRLLGVILLGNTFANILASSIATLLAVHYLGEIGLVLATVLLTCVILIFSETAPKTFAALYPERVAEAVCFILALLLKIFYPLVWFINAVANVTLKLFGVRPKHSTVDQLSTEEFATLVSESSSGIGVEKQSMMLGVLSLSKVTIADVMVPSNEVHGIDITTNQDKIESTILNSHCRYLPVYEGSLNVIRGTLYVPKLLVLMTKGAFTVEQIKPLLEPPYFIPEGAVLGEQLNKFRQHKCSFGIVVDEYQDIKGIVTLQDVLEEIVGEFSRDFSHYTSQIRPLADGAVLVSGAINIRDLNRQMDWALPTAGPKTLSGLVVEHLELIPSKGIGLRVSGYPMEVTEVEDNMVVWVKIWPNLKLS
jgi:Mg2+/Co2+ transporter CorB